MQFKKRLHSINISASKIRISAPIRNNKIKMSIIIKLLHLVRISHTLFALPFALLGAVMAWKLNTSETPPVSLRLQDGIGILLCMVFARSAAMAFNRIADRRLDALNPRTEKRELVTGALSLESVILFTLICSIGFILSTALFLPNLWPLICSVPVLLFLLGYSYAKRFTQLAHYWLSAGLMLSPVGAWVALRPPELDFSNLYSNAAIAGFPLAPWGLAAAVLFWVGGFDIIYACQDFEVDKKLGLKSIPAVWGVPAALKIAAVSHVFMLIALGVLPLLYPLFGTIWYIGLAILSILIIIEHVLVKPNDLTRVNIAFFHINAIVSIGLLILGVSDIFL